MFTAERRRNLSEYISYVKSFFIDVWSMEIRPFSIVISSAHVTNQSTIG